MEHDFRAIVICGHFNAALNDRAYAFEAFSAALAFLQSVQAATVIIEFSVETDTLDFYDAVKALKVPVIFSANRLNALQFDDLGIRAPEIVYPERRKQSESFADYRLRSAYAARSLTSVTSV